MKLIRLFISVVLLIVWTNSYSQRINDTKTWEQKQEERKKKQEEQFKALKKRLPDFPNNCVVVEFYPSCAKGEGYYFSNGVFLYDHVVDDGSKKFTLGKWHVKSDSIVMIDSLEFGLRAIGPFNLNEGTQYSDCPTGYHNEYVKYEKIVKETRVESIDIYLYPMSDYSVDTTKTADTDYPKYKGYLLDGDYKTASIRQLNDSELELMTKEELRLMRNEIFARYGYKFKSTDLRNFFMTKDWYKPSKDNADDYLTDIERWNIKMIRKFELK